MPSMRKLSTDEVQSLQKDSGGSVRAEIAREYDSYLADFVPGDYGEALLAEDENKLTVRNRLKAAASRRGWTLEFPRTQGPLIRFKIVSENGDEATEVFAPAHEEEELAVAV